MGGRKNSVEDSSVVLASHLSCHEASFQDVLVESDALVLPSSKDRLDVGTLVAGSLLQDGELDQAAGKGVKSLVEFDGRVGFGKNVHTLEGVAGDPRLFQSELFALEQNKAASASHSPQSLQDAMGLSRGVFHVKNNIITATKETPRHSFSSGPQYCLHSHKELSSTLGDELTINSICPPATCFLNNESGLCDNLAATINNASGAVKEDSLVNSRWMSTQHLGPSIIGCNDSNIPPQGFNMRNADANVVRAKGGLFYSALIGDDSTHQKDATNFPPLKSVPNFSPTTFQTHAPLTNQAAVREEGGKTWSNLLVSQKRELMLEYLPEVVNQRESRILVAPPREVSLLGEKKWSSCMVGWFLGERLSFTVVNKFLIRNKSDFGEVLLTSLGNGMFLFNFKEEEGLKKAIDLGLWFINGLPMLLKKWMPNMDLSKGTPTSAAIWVRMYGIPLEFWTAKGLSCIASALGRPLSMDAITEQGSRVQFARVSIDMVLSDPFPSEVDLILPNGETRVITVEYAWKPNVCALCNCIGHYQNECPTSKIVLNQPNTFLDASGALKVWQQVGASKIGKQILGSNGIGVKDTLKVCQVENELGAAPTASPLLLEVHSDISNGNPPRVVFPTVFDHGDNVKINSELLINQVPITSDVLLKAHKAHKAILAHTNIFSCLRDLDDGDKADVVVEEEKNDEVLNEVEAEERNNTTTESIEMEQEVVVRAVALEVGDRREETEISGIRKGLEALRKQWVVGGVNKVYSSSCASPA